jgi:Recombinase zinc beta ribbon domain
VPRKGQALLQGIVRCGYCGAFLHLRHSGPHGDFPVYVCSNDQRQFGGKRCQEVRAIALDTQVEQRFLEALRPDQVALALAAPAQLEQEEGMTRLQEWLRRARRVRKEEDL